MIVCFGSINLDLVFPLPHIPAVGETVLTPTVTIVPGGKGANQALAAARDGATVAMAGAVGGDSLANDALVLLRSGNVDLSRVARTLTATGTAAVLVDPAGHNAIAVGSGANLMARARQVEDDILSPATTILLQMEVATDETVALIRRARARGARIVLNLAPAGPLPRDVMEMLDVLVVNELEAAYLAAELDCGATASDLHVALGIGVVRTLGAGGCEYASRDGVHRLQAHPVAVRDSTAAGDCFTGILAASLDRGLPMATALQRANAGAAICCTRPGAQPSLPNRAEIDAAIA